MTQEEKDLLLKDLCARLPYGVKMNHIANNDNEPITLIGVAKDMITLEGLGGYEYVDIEDYKPYLFPLSSMTEEQWKELTDLQIQCGLQSLGSEPTISPISISDVYTIDWLNKNHFDYRGLIPKGLAIDATGKNIY